MPGDPLAEVIRRLRPAPDRPDADLVRRYAAGRDPAAFEALVRRHGPTVLGVCRRVLRPGPDAEDAFQATFLVLARKAAAVRDPAAVGNWLYGVAHNVARRLRAANARRRAAEAAVEPTPQPPAGGDDAAVVDDELALLPDRYRAALVACGVEGQTIRDAAATLGWPPGTVATRLARGRALLARRLVRRGVAVPAALAALGTAPVSAELIERAMPAGVVPAAVLTLTNEVTRAMLLTKFKAAAAVVLVAGLGVAAVTAQPPAAAPAAQPPAPAKADPPAPTREVVAAQKHIARLLELKPQGGGQSLEDDTAVVLRDLIKLGPAATPAVIAALDETTDPFLLRCLGYAARAIGDKKVVPALIRAFPKTCLPSASDYGNISKDPELLAFLQEHSHDKHRGTHYSFGRPTTEFRSALRTLTGTKQNEMELNFASLSGSPRQQELQREQFRRVAERWAAWWDKNGRELVGDAAFTPVRLPPRPKSVAPPPPADFPHGPRVKVGGGSSGGVLESARAAKAGAVFYDLDSGRQAPMPEKLKAPPGRADRLDDITAWAAEEGFDLMGTEMTGPGGEVQYVVRGLGLTAWEVDTARRQTLRNEVRAEGMFEMGRPAGGLLAPFDKAAGRHAPAEPGLFLFRTREGGFGWLFVGAEVHDDTLQPGGPAGGDIELSPVAFQKGRRLGYTLVWEEPEPGEGR